MVCAAVMAGRITATGVVAGVTDMGWAPAWDGFFEPEAELMRVGDEAEATRWCEERYGSPMSVMPVPELPGALCHQHPDPDLWTSGMRSEQEEARRVCRICPELADCRAWTLAQPAYRMDAAWWPR